MILLSTALRPIQRFGPEALVRLAGDVGAQGTAGGPETSLDLLALAAPLAAGAGLPLSAIALPLPEGPLPLGKRVPHLAALDDREERLAAVTLARRVLEAGRDLGVRRFMLEPETLPLGPPWSKFLQHFARRELDEDEPGGRLLAAAREDRRLQGDQFLDAFRFSLERILRACERLGVELWLGFAATPWGLPTPREALALVDEWRGAPLGLTFHAARWTILERLSLHGPVARQGQLARASSGLIAADAVGLADDFAPGLGESFTRPEGLSPELTIVTGRADTSPDELRAACQGTRQADVTRARP